jgi:hypothetical protein
LKRKINLSNYISEHTKDVANLQVTATTGSDYAVFGPQVVKWLEQYHELAVLSGLVLSLE